jgi:hypothetical protein
MEWPLLRCRNIRWVYIIKLIPCTTSGGKDKFPHYCVICAEARRHAVFLDTWKFNNITKTYIHTYIHTFKTLVDIILSTYYNETEQTK